MIIIAAMSEDRVIGNGDALPWNVPQEYEQYKWFIKDQTVVMGRRSFEIFGRELTSRHAVVVSRSDIQVDGAATCSDLTEAIEKAQSFGRTVFINGGASIYEQTLPLVDHMYLSVIRGQFDGDAFFPQFDQEEWAVTERRDFKVYEFRHYRRKNASAS